MKLVKVKGYVGDVLMGFDWIEVKLIYPVGIHSQKDDQFGDWLSNTIACTALVVVPGLDGPETALLGWADILIDIENGALAVEGAAPMYID
jgi:hypothetical protein